MTKQTIEQRIDILEQLAGINHCCRCDKAIRVDRAGFDTRGWGFTYGATSANRGKTWYCEECADAEYDRFRGDAVTGSDGRNYGQWREQMIEWAVRAPSVRLHASNISPWLDDTAMAIVAGRMR